MARHRLSRDDHLFAPGPKRVLSLDGGGVLGVIEIAFIEKIEDLLRKRTGDPDLVLSDYFDLIGGTSTGAIIATALALGKSSEEVKKLYFDFAPAIFKRTRFGVPGVGAQFDARALANKLRYELGDRELGTEDLVTGLAIVAKRMDTGSPWVLTNNPRSKYWNDPAPNPITGQCEFIGNKKYLLRNLVRASTAAPFYFSPKRLEIAKNEMGLFVDGGVTPHNNPSLQLLMLAGIQGYGFCWPIDESQLMMISVGTGWMRPRVGVNEGWGMMAGGLAVRALRGLVWDAQVNTLKVMQWLSEPRRPWPINSEVGTLEQQFISTSLGSNVLLQFQRYDIAFESAWLKEELDVEMSDAEAAALNQFTRPSVMPKVYELARLAAERHVDGADFPAQFDL